MEKYRAKYGEKDCIAYPEHDPIKGLGITYRYFSIFLTKDPGYGSMQFFRIGRAQIDFIDEPPAEALGSAS